MRTQYIKTAWRNLWRYKAGSIINLTGLSIGMAAAMLIFMWVKNETSFDSYHKDADHIFRIKNYLAVDKNSTWVWENSPYLLGEAAKKEIPGIINVARVSPMVYNAPYFNIKGDLFKEEKCAYVDQGWFDVFNYDFISGTAKDFDNHPYNMVLTASKAKKYFGSDNPVGKTIRIDTIDYEIGGVVKDNPVNSSFQYDVLISLASRRASANSRKNDDSWGNFNYLTFVKLMPAANQKQVVEQLEGIMHKQRQKSDLDISLQPLAGLRFENDLQSSQLLHTDKKVVYIFSVLGILLLLIACINYVNLTTARAAMRAKEVSVKKIMGAAKTQLLAQFITESAVMSVLALLLTVGIMKLVMPLFNTFTEQHFTLSLSSISFWAITGGTLLTTILLTSIYPALMLSSFKPLAVFRGINVLGVKDSGLRKGLVMAQFTISIVLIVGTIVIYRQLHYINNQSAAYNRSQVMSFSIPFKLVRNMDETKRQTITESLKRELSGQAGIETVSFMNQGSVINMDGFSSGSSDWDGRAEDFKPGIAFFYTDSNLKNILHLQLAEGRWFRDGDAGDAHNSILNETAVKEFNLHQPHIGQRFVRQGDTGIVIGVVKDFYYKSMHDKIGPVVLSSASDYNLTYLVKILPGQIATAKKSVSAVWGSFFNSEPLEFNFLDEEFNKLYHNDQKTAVLIWIFSAIAIFISCLGLFGLATFTAERKTKEIGIRKILGAGTANIVALVSKEFLYIVLSSMLIAFPLAWWAMNKWLENFAYRISLSWWIFFAAAFIALCIALATVSIQAIRAAWVNPVKSLRTE
ncbi:MAG: ABC transporter permease [Bacteroidetes bacterium]|nr:ABC transporter permease [Bacteroidota bacterium]